MRKLLSTMLVAMIVLSIVTPAMGNYREDFVYSGHYLFMRQTMRLYPTLAVVGAAASVMSGASMGFIGSPYADSALPEWDFDVIGGVGLTNADHMGVQGFRFEADMTTLHAGINASKDRMLLGGIIHYEDIEGKGTNGNGLDSQNSGLLLMPGYRLLTQEEDGVNLEINGILDLSYSRHTQIPSTPSAWYIRPGLRTSASLATKVGMFQSSYTYCQLRNIDGDNDQFTGKSSVSTHAMAFDYLFLITEQVVGNIGISHITFNDMPTGMDDEFTDLNLRLGSDVTERLKVSAGYFQAIDGRETDGFNLSVVWAM